MLIDNYRRQGASLLAKADIQINGTRPWDIQVRDERLYSRALRHGVLGVGEAYMDGWFDCQQLDQFVDHVFKSGIDKYFNRGLNLWWQQFLARIINSQSPSRAFQVGKEHYDKGNDLYQAMLDQRLTYTCGYWKNGRTLDGVRPVKTLDEAQEAKLDLVCRKLGLKPGMRLLDIGCGWGSLMKFAAERYGVSCVGVTVSKEQMVLGQKLCAGLPVEFRLQDYRLLQEKFDRVASLGMFEHVGYKNYQEYMTVARRCLDDNGLFLLHTFGGKVTVHTEDPWFNKYIFPNSMVPSITQIGQAIEHIFVMEDWHNFGADYDTTLMAWFANFNRSWPTLKSSYDERFYRMWKYYLLCFAGTFRSRTFQLWQIVLSPHGVPGGYGSIR